jgi:hypothetical protein
MNTGTEVPALATVNVEQEEAQLNQEIQPVVQQANAIQVRNAAEFEGAAGFLKSIKASQKRVTDFFGPIKAAAHAAWKRTTEGEATFLKPLQEAEKTVKTRMVAWQAEEDRKAEAERLRLQAIEDERVRKQRAEQERLARIQREKEEAARRAEEEARRKAAAEQDAAKRKQLEAEAERKRKEADAAAAKAAERDERAASVAPAVVIQVESAAPVVEGVSSRKAWKATVTDKKAFVAFAAQDVTGMFLGAVEVNEIALGKLAKGDKAPTLPGVRFTLETIMSSRSK